MLMGILKRTKLRKKCSPLGQILCSSKAGHANAVTGKDNMKDHYEAESSVVYVGMASRIFRVYCRRPFMKVGTGCGRRVNRHVAKRDREAEGSP